MPPGRQCSSVRVLVWSFSFHFSSIFESWKHNWYMYVYRRVHVDAESKIKRCLPGSLNFTFFKVLSRQSPKSVWNCEKTLTCDWMNNCVLPWDSRKGWLGVTNLLTYLPDMAFAVYWALKPIIYLPTYLPTYLLAYLPAYLPTYLPELSAPAIPPRRSRQLGILSFCKSELKLWWRNICMFSL